MKDFLDWSEVEHAAHPRTHQRYKTSSVALLRYFGSKRLDSITAEDAERFKTERAAAKNKRTKRPLRPATTNRELACAKAVFNFAIKSGLLLQNPFSKIRFLAEQNEQTRVLTYGEQQKYLAEASQPLKDIAVVMLETGMRPEEVYTIERENVHLVEGFLFNPIGKTKSAKRKIALTVSAADVLRARLNKASGRYLFPHEKDADKPMLKVNNAHSGALKRSSVPYFRFTTCGTHGQLERRCRVLIWLR